jgi:hypothetical protein
MAADLEQNFDLSPNIRAVFLIFLAVSSNFIGSTMNCSIQKIMTENAAVRHLFVLLIIYFTIDFTSKHNMHPIQILKNALFIYLLFIVLTKQTNGMFILNILIIFLIYICSIMKEYIQKHKENNEENKDTYLKWNEENLNLINKYLQYILLMTLTIGFILYFNKQYTDHTKNFSIIIFLLGLNKCGGV